MQADGSFVSEVPAMPGDILHLYIKRYTANGPVKELIIEGTLGCIKVLTEYGIRYVLCDGRTEVIRQDNTAVSAPTIMPSAFFSLEEILQNGIVTGYEIKGGGYGHGVGMSQNAAKHMAKEGMKYEEILSFFYKDCIVEDIYGNEEKSL